MTYQGNELASALIQFWKGTPLNKIGLNYFYAYGASHYESAVNRLGFEDKINWVKSHLDEILQMDAEFILKADSPILFSAFCLEMKKLNNDKNTLIHMPVFIDATCSGIQHLSAMVADTDLALKVNLTDLDTPEDIYANLVEPINKAINEYGKNHSDVSSLSEIYLDHSVLKHPIMTQNYNVSIFGMKEQLLNSLKVKEFNTNGSEANLLKNVNEDYPVQLKKNPVIIIGYNRDKTKEIKLNQKDLIKMAMIIKQVIFLEFPALQAVYEYFINIARVMKLLNLTLQWISPTGAIITQNYKKRKKSRLRVFIHNRSKVNIMQEITRETDHKKQIDGIIPNVIHSLDSAHVAKLINDSAKNIPYPIVAVHDCFGTHPNFMDVLFFRLKEEFVSLYLDRDFLKLFHKRILQNIKDNKYEVIRENDQMFVHCYKDNKMTEKILLPNPPKQKDLDIKGILKSKYMFK